MKRHKVCFTLLFAFSTTIISPVLAEIDPNDKAFPPRMVLEQIQERLSTISNYQCTHIQVSVAQDLHDPNLPPVKTDVSRKQLACDSQRHGRVRELYKNLTANTYI